MATITKPYYIENGFNYLISSIAVEHLDTIKGKVHRVVIKSSPTKVIVLTYPDKEVIDSIAKVLYLPTKQGYTKEILAQEVKKICNVDVDPVILKGQVVDVKKNIVIYNKTCGDIYTGYPIDIDNLVSFRINGVEKKTTKKTEYSIYIYKGSKGVILKFSTDQFYGIENYMFDHSKLIGFIKFLNQLQDSDTANLMLEKAENIPNGTTLMTKTKTRLTKITTDLSKLFPTEFEKTPALKLSTAKYVEDMFEFLKK